jgi:methionine synthase I (cobalamin-dependent)
MSSPLPPPRSGRSLLDAIGRGAVIGDGAMGTALHERGVSFDVSYEELSVSRPELIERVHDEHLRAGAQVLESNTFGANRVRLARHGLGGRVRELNLAAAALARRVAGDHAWVAGAIGPTGLPSEGQERGRMSAVFREQAEALAEAGVDALMIETMRWPEEIEAAVLGARLAAGERVPIFAQVSVDDALHMADGTPIERMGERLAALGCDVIGVNCGGPELVLAAVARLLPLGVPVSAVPSAGLPRRAGDRFVYDVTPEVFGAVARRMVALGVRLIGGCCGTTSEHVRRLAAGGDEP